jgi:hypothetical protein
MANLASLEAHCAELGFVSLEQERARRVLVDEANLFAQPLGRTLRGGEQ